MIPCFPAIIGYKQGFIAIDSDAIIATQLSLKKGFFKNNLWVIDSEGQQWEVVDARSIGGVGWFFGYNIFFNRKIRVQMVFRKVGSPLSPEETLDKLKTLIRIPGSGELRRIRAILNQDNKSLSEVIYELAFHDDTFNYIKQRHPVFGAAPKEVDQ